MTSDSAANAHLRVAAVRGLRWTMIARPTAEVVRLGSMVLLARLIPPAEFGRYAIAVIVVQLGLIPASGVTTALVQRSTTSREHLQTGFALALLSGLVLVGLTLVAASTIVVALFGSRTAELVRLSTPGCLVGSLMLVPMALLQRRLAFRRLTAIDMCNTVICAAASIGLAIAGFNGESLVLGALAGSLAAAVLTWRWAPPPPPRLYREATKDVLGYGAPAALAAVSWIGFSNCDYVIIGARLGPRQAGFYFRAYTLGVGYQSKVSQIMNTVGFPVLARAQDREHMDELRGRMVEMLTMVLFPLLVLLAIEAPVAVPFLFGPAWAPAVVPTQILAVGGAGILVIDAVGSVLMAAGRPRALLGFGWAHFGAYALAVLVVSPLGLTAVAISAAVVHGAFAPLSYGLMLRGADRKPLSTLWRDIRAAAVSCVSVAAVAVPSALALSAIRAPATAYLAAVSAAGLAAYLITLRAWFSLSFERLLAVGHQVLDNPLQAVRRRFATRRGRAGTPLSASEL